jgi:Skp family chaperone for outer membrane proteins
MKKYLLLIALLIPATGFAETLKVGVVDVMRLFNEYAKMTGIDDKLQTRFAAPKKELEDLAKDIEAQEKQLKANEVMMTESKTKKAKESLIEKVKQYREKEAVLSKDLQAMRNQELSTFREIVMAVTQKLAKDESYSLIMQADGVMYVDDSYNITSKILTRLKAEVPKK